MATFSSEHKRYKTFIGGQVVAFQGGLFRTPDEGLAEALRKHPDFQARFFEMSEKARVVVEGIVAEEEKRKAAARACAVPKCRWKVADGMEGAEAEAAMKAHVFRDHPEIAAEKYKL